MAAAGTLLALALPATAVADASRSAAGNGGTRYDAATDAPVLAAFSLAPAVLTPGATPSLTVRVDSRAKFVRLRLVVTPSGAGATPRQIDLGRRPTRKRLTIPLTALADQTLPEGTLAVRIAGRDSAHHVVHPAAHLSSVQQLAVRAHVFPVAGPFNYGGPDARFGAQRDGHTHQGQDILAAEGTPVVAVRSGTIFYVGYQASGAGYYVVLDADGEDYDYAFMHLKEGSTRVVTGQHVDMGQQLGDVGHTGDATANHLHFEVWQGAWFAGGHAIDPLPFLEQWQTSPPT